MIIKAKCPHCHKEFNVEKQTQGKLCQCPNCSGFFRIPQLDKAISKSKSLRPNVFVDAKGNIYG